MQSITVVIMLAKLVPRMRKSGENYPEKHTGRLLVVATAMLTIAPLAYAETSAVPPSGGYVTALTDSGLVRGKLTDDGDVEIYQGIPYAAPPVANLRWAPPQPMPSNACLRP